MSQNEVDFFETIRGVEVKVVAANFPEDASAGIGLWPEEVYANVLNQDGTVGEAFELTDAEIETLGIKATEIYWDRDDVDVWGSFWE